MMAELDVSPRGWDNNGDTEQESDDSSSDESAYHYGDDDETEADEDEDEYEGEGEDEEGEHVTGEGDEEESDAGDDMEQDADEVLAEVLQAEEFQRDGAGDMEISSKMPVEAAASEPVSSPAIASPVHPASGNLPGSVNEATTGTPVAEDLKTPEPKGLEPPAVTPPAVTPDARKARKLELLRMLEQEAERLKLLKKIADSNRNPTTTSPDHLETLPYETAMFEADAASHSLNLAEPEPPIPEPVPVAEACGLDQSALEETVDKCSEKAADAACSAGQGGAGLESAPDPACTREDVVNEMVAMAAKLLMDDWAKECEQAEQKLQATACASMLPQEWNNDQPPITREDQLKKALPKEPKAKKNASSARGRGRGRKGRGKVVVSDSEESDGSEKDDCGDDDEESSGENGASGSNGDTGGMHAFWDPEEAETKTKRTRQPKQTPHAAETGPSDSADGLPRSKRAKQTRPAEKIAAERKAMPKAGGETEKKKRKVDVENLTPEQLAARARLSRKSAAYHKAKVSAMKRGLCEKAYAETQ